MIEYVLEKNYWPRNSRPVKIIGCALGKKKVGKTNNKCVLNHWNKSTSCYIELLHLLGYCCIAYYPCSDSNSFNFNPGAMADNSLSGTGTVCTEDYLVIEGQFTWPNIYILQYIKLTKKLRRKFLSNIWRFELNSNTSGRFSIKIVDPSLCVWMAEFFFIIIILGLTLCEIDQTLCPKWCITFGQKEPNFTNRATFCYSSSRLNSL